MEARDEMNCRRASCHGAELRGFSTFHSFSFSSVRGDPVIYDTFARRNLDTEYAVIKVFHTIHVA